MSTADRRGRAAELVGWLGAELLLAANPASVTWLTGYVAQVETGASPFAVPPLALREPPDQAMPILPAERAGAAERLGVAAAAYHVHGAGPRVAVAAATRVLQELVGEITTDGCEVLSRQSPSYRAPVLAPPTTIV